MNPILKYPGGKQKDIPKFIKEIPLDFHRYFEPFLGGGSVFFHLEPRQAVLGDVNKKLITFYTQLRDQYPEMRTQLSALQEQHEANQAAYEELKHRNPAERCKNKNEELYYRLRSQYNHPTGEFLDGTLYYFINKTAYSGMLRFNLRGEYNVPFGHYKRFNTNIITEGHSRLLQNAELHHADYHKLLERAQSGDFMFLDPPYDCVFTSYGNNERESEFAEDAHRQLAADFRNLTCRSLMVISSTPLTEELYAPFITGRYEKRYAVNIRNRFKAEAIHLIVKNY